MTAIERNPDEAQQFLELSPAVMPENSPLDPHFIALPIFQPAPNNIAKDTKETFFRETHYEFGKHHYRVRFHSNEPLRRLDRTILSLIEIFYSYQNPNCETEYAFFSFSDVRRLLGNTTFNNKQYKESLLRLHNTNMDVKWVTKEEDSEIEKINEYLNLISEIRIISFKDKEQNKSFGSANISLKHADVVRVRLSSIHINNIRNGMVRYLPVDKILKVKNNTAGLIIYWISAFGYLKEKGKKPIPKPNFTVDYIQICRYLYLKPRVALSSAKQQFTQALNELTEKDVLSSWELYENSEGEYKIRLYLRAFDEWEKEINLEPKQKRPIPKKLYTRLHRHGLTDKQIKTISLMEETIKGIENKVDQLEWLMEKEPHKIRNGNTAQYLYASIANGWVDKGFEAYKLETEKKVHQDEEERRQLLQISFAWEKAEQQKARTTEATESKVQEGQRIASLLSEDEKKELEDQFIEESNQLIKRLSRDRSTHFFTSKFHQWLAETVSRPESSSYTTTEE